MLLLEYWKPVPGWEGRYEVSCKGTIRRIGSSKPLKQHLSVYGYPSVSLGSRGARCVHIIVATAFHGPRPAGLYTDHVNGNKGDPSASNLEYVTPAENTRRAKALGFIAVGERLPQAILTEPAVKEILKLKGMADPKDVASRFGTSYWNVYRIWRRDAWAHVVIDQVNSIQQSARPVAIGSC